MQRAQFNLDEGLVDAQVSAGQCRHVDILSDQAEVTGLETWELP